MSCSSPTGPFPEIQLRTAVTPSVVLRGDSVMLLGILHNPTTRTVEVTGPCGPPVLFEVRTSSGEGPIHPIPLDGAWLCPMDDDHVLEPGETDTVSVSWRPGATGSFAVRSGFRVGGRLERLTSPATLTVR